MSSSNFICLAFLCLLLEIVDGRLDAEYDPTKLSIAQRKVVIIKVASRNSVMGVNNATRSNLP
jgi:hypothetical protein